MRSPTHRPRGGSSPLARGLRRRRRHPARDAGIIPARAGFTWRRPSAPPTGTDHPRSRGVYSARTRARSPSPGSSPLARGLPSDIRLLGRQAGIIPARAGFTSPPYGRRSRGSDHPRSRGVYVEAFHAFIDWVRIIPARAGFTRRARSMTWPVGDHPRSRGVYSWARTTGRSSGGSSPLARGLLSTAWDAALTAGIIPARAGFTWPRSRVRSPPCGSSPLARGLPWATGGTVACAGIIPARAGFTPGSRPGRDGRRDHPRSRGVYRATSPGLSTIGGSSPLARGLHPDDVGLPGLPVDHPRSRGVYRAPLWSAGTVRGSSPLARGLRADHFRLPGRIRIIPARAGFTRGPRPRRPAREDHPRSRGVYQGHHHQRPHRTGSSPLARGLRDGAHRARGRVRIIPARAGVTRCPVCGTGTARDHPRSRGVYICAGNSPWPRAGSSPLARGLPGAAEPAVLGYGIIPARAGFTTHLRRHCHDPRDHPRSRGVYSTAARTVPSSAGSSPLARGLRRRSLLLLGGPGIIPARAGFTLPPPRRRGTIGDHPRSRGVYPSRRPRQNRRKGSSPLARGLPGVFCEHTAVEGIIPARAGFTPGIIPGPPMVGDHPRSRGVYP